MSPDASGEEEAMKSLSQIYTAMASLLQLRKFAGLRLISVLHGRPSERRTKRPTVKGRWKS